MDKHQHRIMIKYKKYLNRGLVDMLNTLILTLNEPTARMNPKEYRLLQYKATYTINPTILTIGKKKYVTSSYY